MYKRMNFLLLFCSLAIFLNTQRFDTERRDTILVRNGYQISLTNIDKDSVLVNKITAAHESEYTNPILTDFDTIRTLLGDRIQYKAVNGSIGDKPEYNIESIVCNNGFKLIFRENGSEIVYYPIEKLVSVRNDYIHTFSLEDGMRTFPPNEIYLSSDKKQRWGYDQGEKVLEVYDPKEENYVRLINFYDIYEGGIYWEVWRDNVLYFKDDNQYQWWAIKVTPLEK